MPRKYAKAASDNVRRVMKKRKAGTLKSGTSKKKVTSRKQAIAIALSEVRRAGEKVPKAPTRKTAKKSASKTAKRVKKTSATRSRKTAERPTARRSVQKQ